MVSQITIATLASRLMMIGGNDVTSRNLQSVFVASCCGEKSDVVSSSLQDWDDGGVTVK